ncbi:putative pentatricopeptide repeat-containing protein [Hibiscus syriacus]|uniref:Pentatricopeptide repeat-containing protein n=1 Tax=Hibiscus syriacus TaxID=106335 RepID=A0A6A3D3B5_HIBSY|nr:putative pentatricopeptide repeat-containing protein [Hibiscus syriacus]
MKLNPSYRPLKIHTLFSKRRFCSAPKVSVQDNDETAKDAQMISNLKLIVRERQSWKIALNDTDFLKTRHVEEVLIQTLDDPRFALRFFNFLGLHRNFHHSPESFCVLIHALLKVNLFWPASSLLQTLLLRGLGPSEVFEALSKAHEKCKFPSGLGFDLLIQNYVQNKRALVALMIFRLMRKFNSYLLPHRTLSALLNELAKIRQFGVVLEVFDEIVKAGVRPDIFIYTVVIRSFCELKDFVRAKEMIHLMESNGTELNVVVYNVLIHWLCKNLRVWEAVEIKNGLVKRGLKADVITYNTLVLGLCRVDHFDVAVELMNEMLKSGFVPSEAVVTNLVDGLRRKGKFEDALSLLIFNEMGRRGLHPNDVTFSILIDSFCRRGEMDVALSFLGKMRGLGIKATIYPYNSLISGYCKLGNLNLAESFLYEMINEGLLPTVVTYTSLISGYCNEGKLHKAFRLYHEMTEKAIAPNTYTFTALISGLRRENMMA